MEQKINVVCDYKTSPLCKETYSIGKYRVNYNRNKNNGKYRCKYCAINDTHLGHKSHFYKNIEINHDFFNNIDCEIKAYLLGVIAGDGSISTKQIEIVAANKDIETILLFQQYVAPGAKIYKPKNSNCSRIKIQSKNIVSDLCRHLKINTGKKSDKIIVPDILDTLFPHFFRGLIDTDGCIDNPYKAKTIRCFYSSTSRKILEEISFKMNNIDIFPYINGIKLNFVGRNALKVLNYLYKDASFALSRKKEYAEIWRTWKPYEGTIINPSKRKKRKIRKNDKILCM